MNKPIGVVSETSKFDPCQSRWFTEVFQGKSSLADELLGRESQILYRIQISTRLFFMT